MRGRVFVELDTPGGAPIRLFRTARHAHCSPASDENRLAEWPRRDAMQAIRKKVYDRAQGRCVACDTPLSLNTYHMHERLPRGKGGQVSLENSEARCAPCHIGPTGAHGKRRPQFSGRRGEQVH